MVPFKCSRCGRFGETESSRCPACGGALAKGDILDFGHVGYGSALGWMLIGFLFTLATAFPAYLMAAAGHGWMLPAVASLITVLNNPVTGLAWAFRGRRQGWWISLYLLLSAVVWDMSWFIVETRRLDDRFERVWSVMPWWVVLWAVLYFGPQVFSLWVLYCADVRGHRERTLPS